MAKTPTGKVSRLAKLSSLSTRVGSSYVARRMVGAFQGKDLRRRTMEKLHIENAQRIVDTVGTLKGAAMKLGQTAALMVEGMDLPPEVAGVLRQLNDKATPVSFDIIREDVEAALGQTLEDRFARFESAPLGTASLGQVHAATLHDGREVVVKVLHRGVDDAVDSDLAALKGIFFTGRILKRSPAELEAIFQEVRARLHEEVNYAMEADHLDFFSEGLSCVEGVRVPRPIREHCTQRVLTMERMPGVPLDEFLQQASPEARQRAGIALAESFHQMVYELRALNADPHAGNYLFTPDGEVSLLDFGCVRRYELEWIAQYAQVGRAAVDGDKDRVLTICERLGALAEGFSPEAGDTLWTLTDIMAEPFRHQPYRTGTASDTVQEQVNGMMTRIMRHPQIQIPPELLYINRALNGMYSMQRRLQVVCDYGALFSPYAQRAMERAGLLSD